ncbi:MAG: peptide MFS transporter [Pyrinomonadaceae bacterium]|nr:peptide MFS transporter [Pyrinomonadaceae bacterium]MCX7640417.1 peptide MFS transporter [Pyrinomonadaceae bacterium]MDW8304844.1 peptide MFS transporter [Acidobacteriota bacterium]
MEETKRSSFFGHPSGLATLFFTEMWERFSYYGIRPLLVLFMSAAILDGGFGFEREQASAIVGIYAASVYLASLPGGWVADRLLGLQRAILYGAICISAGHISIGLSAFFAGKATFFLGLILIVLGTGLLKPNISAIVGDLYPEGGARRDAGFSIFYMGINLGAFSGQIITGLLGEKYGWHWGFGAAGVGMLLGLLIYILSRRKTLGEIGLHPAKHPDKVEQAKIEWRVKAVVSSGILILAAIFIFASLGLITIDAKVVGTYMSYLLVAVAVIYFAYLFMLGGLNSDEKKRMLVVVVLFVAAAVFWSAFEQAPTSLNLFAKDFTDRNIMGFEVPATWFQSINPLLIIILAPVFASIWTFLGKKGLDLSSPTKFALGLLFAAVGFLIMIFASWEVLKSNGAVKVSIFWLTFSYVFQTIGELCLSPVGLSSMTKLSPRRYVGQVMGIWFLASSLGNLIAGLVGGHVDPEKLDQMPVLFTYTTLALVISGVVLLILAVPMKRMMQKVEGD